jgi:hypothetical protein
VETPECSPGRPTPELVVRVSIRQEGAATVRPATIDRLYPLDSECDANLAIAVGGVGFSFPGIYRSDTLA